MHSLARPRGPLVTMPRRPAIRRVQIAPRPPPFPRVWQATDAALRASRRPSLSNKLHAKFQEHTSRLLGSLADRGLEDVSDALANSCVSLVPLLNTMPLVRRLARELGRRLVGKLPAQNVVSGLVRRCGRRHAVALLALSVVLFMAHEARTWGSVQSPEEVAEVLLEYVPLVAGFVMGRDVSLTELVARLAPSQGNVASIWQLLRHRTR